MTPDYSQYFNSTINLSTLIMILNFTIASSVFIMIVASMEELFERQQLYQDLIPFLSTKSIQKLAVADSGFEEMYTNKIDHYWHLFTTMCDNLQSHRGIYHASINKLKFAVATEELDAANTELFKAKLRANPRYVFKLLSHSIENHEIPWPNVRYDELLGVDRDLSNSSNINAHFYQLLTSIGNEEFQSIEVTYIIGKLFALKQIDKHLHNGSVLTGVKTRDILHLIKRWWSHSRMFAFERGVFEIYFDLKFIINDDTIGDIGSVLRTIFLKQWDQRAILDSNTYIDPSLFVWRKQRRDGWRDLLWDLADNMIDEYQEVDIRFVGSIIELLKHVANTLGFDMSKDEWDIGGLCSKLEQINAVMIDADSYSDECVL